MVIYCITNRQTGKRYVGRTVRSAQRRWDDHLSACYTKCIWSPLYADMRELGREQFDLVILEHVDTYDALMEREIAWIEILGTMQPDGYNKVLGGTSNLGWKPTPETRAKMSAWQRGRVLSETTRAKISAFFKGRPNFKNRGRKTVAWNKGIPHTEEAKAKMRESGKVPWSEQERRGHIGLKRTPESRALIAQRKREWWASLTPQQKQAQVELRTGRAKEK